MVGRIATGEIEEGTPPDDGKDPAAVSLGRKGGKARAAGMTAKKRKEIAKKAAKARWAPTKNGTGASLSNAAPAVPFPR
jgi:hypothetical protein